MENLWISAIQNKLSLQWWMTHGDEQKVIANLLAALYKGSLPQNINLEEAEKLIDYHIFTEPRNYLEDALQICRDDELLNRIKYLLARCYLGLGYREEALASLDQALESEPQNSSYWQLKADCLLELGDWQGAVDSLNKSLRSSPGNDEIIFRMGTIYMYQSQYGEALNCFSGCCKLMPFNPVYWEMKAEMHVKLDQMAAAAESFHKAVKYGGSCHLGSRLAYCYARTGQLKKARNLLLKVLKRESDNYEALGNLAGIYHKLAQDEQSYKLLKKAYTLNCNDHLLLNNLGYMSSKLGRTRKAVDYYHQALELEPEDQTILYNLSVCLYQKGDYEESRATLEKLLEINGKHPGGWILLGNVNEQLSLYQDAVDCFNKSLGLA